MNATSLYITTCRYVIQSNPHDPESWAELYRYLPYLRQALSCCVCGQVLDHPVGSTNGVCQHQVCRDCLGGKMKYVRPQCSWCKDQKGFEENAQLRIVIQCFKKLCEYLSSTAIAMNLNSTTNNGGTNGNTLMGIIREGMTIKDCYTPLQGTMLGLFPPKLQKINANIQGNRAGERVDSREATAQGEGCEGTSNLSMPRVVGGKRRCSAASGSSAKNLSGNVSKMCHRRSSQHSQASTALSEPKTPDISSIASSSPDPKLCDTVATEHDYMNKSQPNDVSKQELPSTPTKSPPPKQHLSRSPNAKTNPPKSPKAAVSKSPRSKKGDHSDLENHTKKRKHSQTQRIDWSRPEKKKIEASSTKKSLDSNSNNNKVTTNANSVTNNPKQSKSRNQKKGQGCRCGLATPNPGKLTCCGQRCPCYSAFKGCENCRCRGCRNPRGDPSRIPIYLKQHQQMQEQQQTQEQQQQQLLHQQVTQIQHQFIQIQDHSQGESAEESDVEVDV